MREGEKGKERDRDREGQEGDREGEGEEGGESRREGRGGGRGQRKSEGRRPQTPALLPSSFFWKFTNLRAGRFPPSQREANPQEAGCTWDQSSVSPRLAEGGPLGGLVTPTDPLPE